MADTNAKTPGSVYVRRHDGAIEYLGCGYCDYRGWYLIVKETGDGKFEIVDQHRKDDVQQVNSG